MKFFNFSSLPGNIGISRQRRAKAPPLSSCRIIRTPGHYLWHSLPCGVFAFGYMASLHLGRLGAYVFNQSANIFGSVGDCTSTDFDRLGEFARLDPLIPARGAYEDKLENLAKSQKSGFWQGDRRTVLRHKETLRLLMNFAGGYTQGRVLRLDITHITTTCHMCYFFGSNLSHFTRNPDSESVTSSFEIKTPIMSRESPLDFR